MIDRSLDAADHTAIGQLRTLLRGDHGLTPEQEEQLIAEFLARRSSVPVLGNSTAAFLTTGWSGWELPIFRPYFIQVATTAAVSLFGLELATARGFGLFYGSYNANPLAALGVAAAGGLLLAFPSFRALYARGGIRGVEVLRTAITTFVGGGLIEYAAIHWPTDSPPIALHSFIFCNLLILMAALLVMAVALAHAVPIRPRQASHDAARLAGPSRPALSRRGSD